MYNKLPIEIKNCTIILKFKQLLRVYVRGNFWNDLMYYVIIFVGGCGEFCLYIAD
jgi:hypothetical protein